jgi:hypothetical protein
MMSADQQVQQDKMTEMMKDQDSIVLLYAIVGFALAALIVILLGKICAPKNLQKKEE